MTPQPSTPIKHAGSELFWSILSWNGRTDQGYGEEGRRRLRKGKID
jgi:hypothetical protein